jgi:hypothetical protein
MEETTAHATKAHGSPTCHRIPGAGAAPLPRLPVSHFGPSKRNGQEIRGSVICSVRYPGPAALT